MDKATNQTEKKVIHVSIGIVANSKGLLLVAKRPEHWLGGGFWEFPGGKIEENEDSETAVKRELLEEVGIVVHSCTPFIQLTYEYPERTIILHAWKVQSFSGEALGLEGQEINWCTPTSLNHLNMLPANRAIVIATQLPDKYLITPNCHNKTTFLKDLEETLLQQQIKLVQLRSKMLAPKEYLSLATAVLKLCREFNTKLLLNHDNLSVLEEVDADGIHLRTDQVQKLTERPLAKNKWVAASCHSVEEIKKAEQLEVDFAVISPVKLSPNKQEPLGWHGFTDLLNHANMPVFALGGMSVTDLEKATLLGAQGIAGTRGIWSTFVANIFLSNFLLF